MKRWEFRETLCFSQWFVAPEGRKVGSLKWRVRSHLSRWEMKSCTPLWREAHLEVKTLKTPHVRSTFGSWAVGKVHATLSTSLSFSLLAKTSRHRRSRGERFTYTTMAMARGACLGVQRAHPPPIQRWQLCPVGLWQGNGIVFLPVGEHSRYGAKHFSKSKCTKHFSLGTLLEVECRKSVRRCGEKHICKSKC